MDRINFKCLIDCQEIELQLDKKAMPGEVGPCYMITNNGCFKGYISRKKNGYYQALGTSYFTPQDFEIIGEKLRSATLI